jgi:hypothetical protein
MSIAIAAFYLAQKKTADPIGPAALFVALS